MTRVVYGPARCIECGAVWRVVHAMLSEEGCIRCGGELRETESAGRFTRAIEPEPRLHSRWTSSFDAAGPDTPPTQH